MLGIELPDLFRLGIAAVVLSEATLLVWRRPTIGVWLLAVASVLQSLGVTLPMNFQSISVYLLDAVTILLVVVTVITVLTRHSIPVQVLVFGALVVIGLLRGVGVAGLQGAFNEGRLVFWFSAGAVLVATCGGNEIWPTVERAWRILATGLLLWAAWFVVKNGLGTYAANGERGLSAPQALIVGQAAVISVVSGARRHLVFVTACGLALLATQQRTALAATVIGVLVVSLRAGRLSSARATRVARFSVVVGVVTALLVLMLGPNSLRESVGTAASTVSTDSGTFGWRIDGWQVLLEEEQKRTLINRLIGEPAGVVFGRYQNGSFTTVSPHNMYLTVLLVTGIVGLVLFVALLIRALIRTRGGLVALHAIVWTALIFGIGYQLGPEQGIVIGAALAATGTSSEKRQRRVAVTSPP